MASTIGRPMSESALRGSSCRSICRPRIPGLARWVIVTKGGIAAREQLKTQFETYLRTMFPGTDTYVKLLEVGPCRQGGRFTGQGTATRRQFGRYCHNVK